MLRQESDRLVTSSGNITLTQTQKSLAASELRYRMIFETSQDGILIICSRTGRIIDANPAIKKMLGYSQKELLEKKLQQLGIFKNIQNFKKMVEELQKDGHMQCINVSLDTKNGKHIIIELVCSSYAVLDEKFIQCNIRDITDRVKIEELSRRKTQQLEKLTEDLTAAKSVMEAEKVKDDAILSCIGEGLIAVDTQNKIFIANKAAESILGLTKKELIGREIKMFPVEDEEGNKVPFTKRPVALALSTSQIIKGLYYFPKTSTHKIPLSVLSAPVILKGKIIGVINIFRDITRDQENERAKNEFVSLASHQLRTPLGIVKWYIEALQTEGYLDSVPQLGKEYLNEIYKNNERLLLLVRDLLSVSRIDQGRVKDNPQLTNIPELIQNIITVLHILAEKHNVKLFVHFNKTNIPSIFIDTLRLQEVIENLITNAILYSKSRGKVDIIVDTIDNNLIISVKDTGIGIPKQDKKMLFTKFFRSANATEKNTEGSGLGLYVVKSYIDVWNGKISVESREGKGSTFCISLPLQKMKRK